MGKNTKMKGNELNSNHGLVRASLPGQRGPGIRAKGPQDKLSGFAERQTIFEFP